MLRVLWLCAGTGGRYVEDGLQLGRLAGNEFHLLMRALDCASLEQVGRAGPAPLSVVWMAEGPRLRSWRVGRAAEAVSFAGNRRCLCK